MGGRDGGRPPDAAVCLGKEGKGMDRACDVAADEGAALGMGTLGL